MLLIFHLCDAVTSWRHVMTSLNLIYLSQLVDVLESWFFFCFHSFFRSLSSKMLLIFHLCDAVTSWRHVMTSLNLIYLSQLVDVLESWFFFCFHGFFKSLSSKMPLTFYFFYFCYSVTSWRHVMTSLNLIHLSQPRRGARKFILFLFTWFCGSLSSKRLMIFYSYDFVTSWRHVMTSQKLFNLSQVMNSL